MAGGFANAQPLGPEERLEDGKALYREARFNEAILQLKEAARQLEPMRQAQAGRAQLADAYLHLALSLIAIGEGGLAKDNVKALLRVTPDASFDPETFAPKVMTVVAQAKAELRTEGPASLPPARESRKKRSSLPLILTGVAGATAAGVAVAAGGSQPGAAPAPAATPTPAPTPPPRRTDNFTWLLTAGSRFSYPVGPVRVAEGPLDVTLNYSGDFTILACVGTASVCTPMGGRTSASRTFIIPTDYPAGLIQALVYFNTNFAQPPGNATGTLTFTYNPQ